MKRSQENIIEIKATPEEVFQAVSDQEQIVKWFAPFANVDPRVGGKYAIGWVEGKLGNSLVVAYEPPAYFATASERSTAYTNKGPVDTGATQRIEVAYYVEAVGGGITRLRLVQSGFGDGQPWDEEYESTKKGWTDFLQKLKELLEK